MIHNHRERKKKTSNSRRNDYLISLHKCDKKGHQAGLENLREEFQQRNSQQRVKEARRNSLINKFKRKIACLFPDLPREHKYIAKQCIPHLYEQCNPPQFGLLNAIISKISVLPRSSLTYLKRKEMLHLVRVQFMYLTLFKLKARRV